jgi:hypothetical protein
VSTRRDTRAAHDRIEVVGELLGREARTDASELSRLASTPEEPAREGDVYTDYVRAPYDPPATAEGKLRSVNLLYETFALMGVEAPGAALVGALREGLGQGATVWGAKHVGGQITWELYFYDPDRRDPRLGVDAVRALLAPVIRVEPSVPRAIAWHMFSVELTREHLLGAPVDRLHVYVNGLDRAGASRSYEYRRDGARLENLYTFHDARTEMSEVVSRLRASTHLDLDRTTIAAALWPELFRCRRVCVANKPSSDGMYFSGVGADQAVYMMEALGWPRAIREYTSDRRDRFDQVRWDVGFDFSTNAGDASPRIAKSAIYATF